MSTYTISTATKTITYTSPESSWDETYTLTHEVEGAEHILTCDRETLRLTYPAAAMWIAEKWKNQATEISHTSLAGLHTLWCEHEKKTLQDMARKLAETDDYTLVGEWIGWSSSDTEGDTPRTTGIYRYATTLVGAYMTGDGYETVDMADLLEDALELYAAEAEELAAELYAGWVASIK